MSDNPKNVTVDPAAAKAGRKRLIEEDAARRDKDAPGSHDPDTEHGDGRRKDAPFNIDIGVTRRAD